MTKRTKQAIEYVAKHPGAKASEISKGIKLKSTGYIYPLLARLVESGELVKNGKCYSVGGKQVKSVPAEPAKLDDRLKPTDAVWSVVEGMNYHMGNAMELLLIADNDAKHRKELLALAAQHLLHEVDRI